MIRWRQAGVWVLLLACATVARADYAAGRLAAVAGTVYVQTPGDPDSHLASTNEVVAEGDQLATWDNAGAELQFAGALLELGPDTVLALTRVDDGQVVAYVVQGTVGAARLPDRAAVALTVQGSHIVASLATAGRLRLSVWPDSQQEWLSVRQGRVTAEADQNALTLYAGQGLQSYFAAGGLATAVTSAQVTDGLDYALLQSDQRLRAASAAARLGDDWIGAAALDDQGEWLQVSSVGPLWVPMFLPSGWAPYRSGHWQWNAVWGWTWIDDLPWCWVPYHYGRWIWWNNRWAWSPGGRRPLFSPAAPPPPGIALQPLPAPWHPGGRVALASRAASVPRAMPAAPAQLAGPPRMAPAALARPQPARLTEPRAPEPRGPDLRGPDLRGPDLRAPDLGVPESRGPELRAPESRGPELRAPGSRGPELRAQDSAARASQGGSGPSPARGHAPDSVVRELRDAPRAPFVEQRPPLPRMPAAQPAPAPARPATEVAEAPPRPAAVSAAPRPAGGPPATRPSASGGASRRPERGS